MQKLGYKRPISLKNSSRSMVVRCQFADNATKIALKEWAPAVKALSNGDQTVLLRKGGIKDPTFKTKAPSFVLFPTTFHTDASLLKPEYQSKYQADCEIDPRGQEYLEFDCVAEVTGQFKTTDPKILTALDPLHIYGPDFLEARLRWKPTQPLTVLELRAYKLTKPLVVAAREKFWGCFSWIDLDDDGTREFSSDFPREGKSFKDLVNQGHMTPALDDDRFVEKQRLCREGLSQLKELETL
ncbi:hypothetical protein Ndes2526A_g08500 [Nannochloris sp. 'desiccata']